MPIQAMVAICRSWGVPVLVDGTHAPGQIPLNVPALGVDWYVANPHKWAFAPKGIAILWCIREHRVTAGVMLLNDAIWIRVSAQIYNELDDYQRLSEIGRTLLL